MGLAMGAETYRFVEQLLAATEDPIGCDEDVVRVHGRSLILIVVLGSRDTNGSDHQTNPDRDREHEFDRQASVVSQERGRSHGDEKQDGSHDFSWVRRRALGKDS
jgi:hypothetical protein